jgi:hypothetical protein
MKITLTNQQAFSLACQFAEIVDGRVTQQRLELCGQTRYPNSAYTEMQAAVRSLAGFERRCFVQTMRYWFLHLRKAHRKDVRGRDYVAKVTAYVGVAA